MFPELPLSTWVLVIVCGAFTAVAAAWDIKFRKIPNKLTLPVFAAGWVYQLAFHGMSGMGDASLGFLIGFGTLFALWMVGGGGGGDVKLMGALSVWLGYRLTLYVMIISTVVVIVATATVVLHSLFKVGLKKSQAKYLATKKDIKPGAPVVKETVQQRQSRRVMAYAVPVAIATWAVLVWKAPTLVEAAADEKANDGQAAATTTDTGSETE